MTDVSGTSLTLGDHAQDLLRPAVIVAPDTPLRAVADTLWEESVGAAVVGTADRPLGIVSERDIVAALGRGNDPDAVTAREIMTAPIVAARPEDRLVEVAYLMFDDVIRHVAILDDLDHVTGIVSVRDLLRPLLVDALGGPQAPKRTMPASAPHEALGDAGRGVEPDPTRRHDPARLRCTSGITWEAPTSAGSAARAGSSMAQDQRSVAAPAKVRRCFSRPRQRVVRRPLRPTSTTRL